MGEPSAPSLTSQPTENRSGSAAAAAGVAAGSCHGLDATLIAVTPDVLIGDTLLNGTETPGTFVSESLKNKLH